MELIPPASTEPKDKKKKPTELRCTLPDDARPSTDEGRELVIPPKRSWSSVFDPFFYCFGARERAALVPGTVVKARFGWRPPSPRKGKVAPLTPPFAIAPVGAAIGQLSPMKELEAPPVTLSEAVKVEESTSSDGSSPPALSLTLPEAMDASRGVELSTTVTVTNTSERSVTTMIRPDTLGFTVKGPAGSVSCGTPKQVGSPIRESFTTLKPKGRAQVSLLLTAVCPPGTFDDPGTYRVFPRIDTRTASGQSIGLRTWDDEASGKKPMILRIRKPRRETVAPKPTLD